MVKLYDGWLMGAENDYFTLLQFVHNKGEEPRIVYRTRAATVGSVLAELQQQLLREAVQKSGSKLMTAKEFSVEYKRAERLVQKIEREVFSGGSESDEF